MTTHFSVLAWRIHMNKRILVDFSPWGRKESDITECREPEYCILSAYCKLHIECSTFHSIIFQDLE